MQNNDLIQSKLEDDEYIIWEGKPNCRRIFTYSDIYMIPITFLLFLLILIQFIPNLSLDLGFVVFTNHIEQSVIKIFFLIPFLLVFFYLFIGRLVKKVFTLKNNEYYLTNKRIFVYSNTFFQRVQRVEYKDNTRRYYSYTSIFRKPFVAHLDYIDGNNEIVAVRNIYGDIDIFFTEYFRFKAVMGLAIQNTEDAEFLLDTIRGVKEDARYDKFKKTESFRTYGKTHYL